MDWLNFILSSREKTANNVADQVYLFVKKGLRVLQLLSYNLIILNCFKTKNCIVN